MTVAGMIPARYASSRFPGKPLADISGRAHALVGISKVHGVETFE